MVGLLVAGVVVLPRLVVQLPPASHGPEVAVGLRPVGGVQLDQPAVTRQEQRVRQPGAMHAHQHVRVGDDPQLLLEGQGIELQAAKHVPRLQHPPHGRQQLVLVGDLAVDAALLVARVGRVVSAPDERPAERRAVGPPPAVHPVTAEEEVAELLQVGHGGPGVFVERAIVAHRRPRHGSEAGGRSEPAGPSHLAEQVLPGVVQSALRVGVHPQHRHVVRVLVEGQHGQEGVVEVGHGVVEVDVLVALHGDGETGHLVQRGLARRRDVVHAADGVGPLLQVVLEAELRSRLRLAPQREESLLS